MKDAAISGTAVAVAQLGDVLGAEVPGVLGVLLERLRNEITRLTAVRAFGTLAASPTVQLGGPGALGLDHPYASLECTKHRRDQFFRSAGHTQIYVVSLTRNSNVHLEVICMELRHL